MQVFEHWAGNGKSGSQLISAAVLIVAFLIAGCENPGQVGSAITGEDTRVVIDTLSTGDFGEHSFIAYSGNYTFASVGEFADPLFGNIRATSVFRPVSGANSNNDFPSSAVMQLELDVNQERIYGDSLSTGQYELVEVDSLWRGNAWKWNDPVVTIDTAVVGSFSVGDEEKILVDLSDEWVEKYRSFYTSNAENIDSLYAYTFYGLAAVPQNTGKIIPINFGESRFLVDNLNEEDFEIPMNQWAYSLERATEPALAADRNRIHSSLENILSVDLQPLADLETVNISRVELVVHADTGLMEASLDQVSPSATRLALSALRLHRVSSGSAPESIDPGNPAVSGDYDPVKGVYRFNLTNLVKSGAVSEEGGVMYYITATAQNGLIQSTVLFNAQAPADRTPKLIVTSIQTVEN